MESVSFYASAWLKTTLTKMFRTHVPGTACFNVVRSDDAITLKVMYNAQAEVHTLKHLMPDKCVVNIM